VPVDAWLNITFDSPPTLGNTGRIAIYKVSDDSQADIINLADSLSTVTIANVNNFRTLNATQTNLANFGFNTAVNYLGYDGLAYPSHTSWRVRIVKYNPVRVVGNQLRIYPHDGVLAYNTQYYVTVANGAVTGTLGGVSFAGVTSKTAWTFTTKAAAPAGSDSTTAGGTWTVNADGVSGDFMTVQGAINAVRSGNTSTIKVTVADGIYEELLSNYNKNNLVINGQSRDGTIIQYENYEGILPGTGGIAGTSNQTTTYVTPNGDTVVVPIAHATTPPTLYEGGRALYHLAASGTEINNLTVKNTHVKTGSSDQAEALYFNISTSPTAKFISRDSHWVSYQDTLQLKGYTWFYNSLIEGDVDFIWGVPAVSLFENCELKTRVDPTSTTSGGYVVQSRAGTGSPGFIFLNSKFTAESGVLDGSAYLARHNGTYPDSSVYVNCTVGPHINAAAFSGTSGTAAPTDVVGLRYANFKNPDTTPWDTSGLPATFYPLDPSQVAALYASNAIIYGGTSISDGATPTPNTYTSIAWALSTAY